MDSILGTDQKRIVDYRSLRAVVGPRLSPRDREGISVSRDIKTCSLDDKIRIQSRKQVNPRFIWFDQGMYIIFYHAVTLDLPVNAFCFLFSQFRI